MTFREKLIQKHPEFVDDMFNGGCSGCPSTYGYERYYNRLCSDRNYDCTACWNREIPEEKGETNMITRKTKAELMEEIEAKNSEIKDLKKEMAALERYKQYDEAANELKAMHDSFINAGFSRDEASRLMLKLIDKCH